MSFTATALTNFFTQGNQMALTDVQRVALQGEGLVRPGDFRDFKKDELLVAFKNVRSLTPPVPIPAKCTNRLLIASVAWNYYTDTGRQVTPANMHFNNVLRDFYVE